MRTLAQGILAMAAAVVCFSMAIPLFADETRTHTSPGLGGYDVPFVPGGTYRSDVESPTDFFGWELGSRPLTHSEVMRYFAYVDENFSNAFLVEYAKSYEGRALVYLTISSEAHAKNLMDVRARIGKLADPRLLKNDAEAREIINTTPAVAWMAYGIHGDEVSSTDAAVQLAYQLIAGTDEQTRKIRDHVIVCIDPMENPDGRARWLKQMEQWNSAVPSPDTRSLNHTGVWPDGRGNHYLFDLNRDWFATVHPESRGKIEAILKWNPQFLLDCHEMGQLDTYLFSPPRPPFNPYMISQIHKWWDIYAKDQAAAFDRYGWSYYTREWNEELFPGYGSSWGIYIGAIGMLYEQSSTDGSLVKRPDGTITTFRESVHHQFASSMANLTTTALRREELLQDYYDEKKRAVGLSSPGGGSRGVGAFVFPKTENEGRYHRFATTVQRQNIEVGVTTEDFRLGKATSSTGGEVSRKAISKGALIIKLNQPLRALIEAIMTFDIPLPTDFLVTERKELLKRNDSRLYENTGWSLALGYNLESYFTPAIPRVKTTAYVASDREAGLVGESAAFGYAIDNTDDRSMNLLARLFENGYQVWCARKPFQVDGRKFGPGSLLIKKHANPGIEEAALVDLARSEGVNIYAVNTALGDKLADLGGKEFALLERPRIALVAGQKVSNYGFGAAWHLLDSRIGYPSSTLDITTLRDRNVDLRKYNVIVMPDISKPGDYKHFLGKAGTNKLKTWVKDGGTLIAIGNGSAFLADTSVALSSVRLRSQVLSDLDAYEMSLEWMKAAENPDVDSLELWGAKSNEFSLDKDEPDEPDLEFRKHQDDLARRLRPRGTILAVVLDGEHWLTFGERSPMPVMFSSSNAFLAKSHQRRPNQNAVEVPVRFAGEDRLRLSGLLWPEARRRWSETAYATRESSGKGQIILFAYPPNFRAYFHGGERLLLNAMVLGPGFGTRELVEW